MTIDLADSVIIDNHAHSLLRRHLEVDVIGFRKAFSESGSMSVLEKHVGNSLHYQNMLCRLRELLEFQTEDDLIGFRQTASSQEHVNLLWDEASIGALLVDDGYLSDTMMPVNELANISQRPIYRILRLEPLFEKLIVKAKSFSDLDAQLESQLRSSARSNVVGLKTIAAYRGGLPSETAVAASYVQSSFDAAKKEIESCDGRFRISRSPVYHHLLLRTFEIAGKHNLPVQVHTGIGDSDLVLHEANPAIMTPIVKAISSCQFVFLHCYPYHKEASYLCSVFPNCHMDLSLSVILVSAIAKNIFFETMALAPTTKILGGTDGHSVPEMHWYGAVSLKQALEDALNQLVSEQYLPGRSAQTAAENILYANCRNLYQLEGLN